jgi:hypothetical protein
MEGSVEAKAKAPETVTFQALCFMKKQSSV